MHRVYPEKVRITVITLLLALAGCSSPAPQAKQNKTGPPEPPGAAIPTNKNPLTKYVELVGFRMSEAGPGKLRIKFSVINHSEADIGDLGLKVTLTTTAAKPGEEPIATFDAQVPALGPQETKDVTVTVPTKMRIYELPDWQFLRGEFAITSPAS